jgi:methionyl-tRNA formyltransferase
MLHALMNTLMSYHQAGRVQVLAVVTSLHEQAPVQWQEAGISFIQCSQGIQAPALLHHLQEVLKPEVILLASWGEILSATTLASLAPMKVWNMHPSLLPAHRGVNPYLASILAGDTESGLTLHQLAAGIDEGKILAQRSVPIARGMSGLDLQARTLQELPLLFEAVFSQLDAMGLEGFHQSATAQPLWGASHHRLAYITQVILNPTSPFEVLKRQAQAVRGWMPCLLPLGHGFALGVESFHSREPNHSAVFQWEHPVSKEGGFVTGNALYYKGGKCLYGGSLIAFTARVSGFLSHFKRSFKCNNLGIF